MVQLGYKSPSNKRGKLPERLHSTSAEITTFRHSTASSEGARGLYYRTRNEEQKGSDEQLVFKIGKEQ